MQASPTRLAAPDIRMRITDPDGADITAARVGDPLAVRFELHPPDSPYDLLVRELVAMDGSDSAHILLVDALGCPTETAILRSLVTVNRRPTTLQANFDAFKFAGSGVVQFRAMVTPCVPRCERVQCGGRTRRSLAGGGEGNTSTVVVGGRLTILERGEEPACPAPYHAPHHTLLPVYTVCVVFGVLVVAQCVIILVCVRLRRIRGDTGF